MLIIPLIPVPSQTLTTTLNNQLCRISVYQKFYGMFIDLYVGTNLIIGGVIAQNLNRIVRDVYLGFDGDLDFYDTQGTSDPYYTGLGSRFVLRYATAAELSAAGITG